MPRFLLLGVFVLSSVLISPSSARADGRNHPGKRYHDKEGHDYHRWNGNEDRAYRSYLDEHHRTYRDFNRVNRNERDSYWGWRHQHPDSTLFKLEVR